MRDPIRVYLADDHAMFILGLTRVFNEHPDIELVGTAREGRAALTDILRLEPEVAVLDVSMPNLTGVQVLAALRASGSQTKGLLLTGTETRETIVSAMSQGACGYLLKTADWDDLIEAIKEVNKGEVVVAPEMAKMLAGEIRVSSILSPREREVLSLLAYNKATSEIAFKMGIEPGSVRSHIRRIYKKLNVSTHAGAVGEAMRRGFIE